MPCDGEKKMEKIHIRQQDCNTNREKVSEGHRRDAEAFNGAVAQRLYRFCSGKTSCADRSLITFVLAYMEEGNHYKLSDTIRLLTLQN